jgi:hypothetical protein
MKGIKTSIKALLALALLLSCTKEAGRQERAIVFDAKMGDVAEVGVQTKAATPITSMTSFYVSTTAGPINNQYPVWNNTVFSWSDSEEAYIATHKWPSPDLYYHFYASNNRIYNEPDKTYVNVENNTDVLCAYMPAPVYLQKNTLEFHHILARLGKITVRPGTVFGEGVSEYYEVTNVTVKLFPWEKGKYDLEKGAGYDDGTGWLARVKADDPVVVAQSAGPLSSAEPYYYQDNDIWLVPETYAILLSWTVRHETWVRSYDEIPAAVPLRAGQINDITFILGGDKSLMFELHTTPQDVVTRDYTNNNEYNNLWD